ncbi:MAG: tRNA (adenosine(37)-N6)-dimethylallyltransferase MiaA [Terriglobia bacterium]
MSHGGVAIVQNIEAPAATNVSADNNPLIVIVGPTAAGKSELALVLAERLSGEVVNYDSVQLYRGFDVGSGKLPLPARRGVAHHLLDCLEPTDVFTAGDYRREALKVLADLRHRGKLAIFAGGTGLYLRALLLGLFEGPVRSEALRERLRAMVERRGREFLHRLLVRLDRAAAARIQPRDVQKLIRAVEVCILAQQPLSAMHARGRVGLEGYQVIKLGLNPPRAELYDRVNRRVEHMFAAGLVEETRTMLYRPDAVRIKPLGALGYRQACSFLEGKVTREEAVISTQAATRHYAKRQLTWFRREDDITWFEGFGDDPHVQKRILATLSRMPAAAGEGALASPAV